MDIQHPQIVEALQSEIHDVSHEPLGKIELFRMAILSILKMPNNVEREEILDDIEHDLMEKYRIGEITMQERLALMFLVCGELHADEDPASR